jgi:mRNA interferase RelE/StbE
VAYRVEFIPKAARELGALSETIQKRVSRTIEQLANNPRCAGYRKLEGTDHLYRIHASKDHVIVYQIEDELVLVLVVRIADRKEVYRNLPRKIIIQRPEK